MQIAAVVRNGPAGRAGLHVGDIVTAVNGQTVEDSRALLRAVAAIPPGSTARLTVQRQGREMESRSRSAAGRTTRADPYMRILVVEDDKDVAGFIVKGLRETGHVVEHADNGRDGLFLAASENFDAIMLDRMLPGGIDGLRLLETLRAQKTRRRCCSSPRSRRWTTG